MSKVGIWIAVGTSAALLLVFSLMLCQRRRERRGSSPKDEEYLSQVDHPVVYTMQHNSDSTMWIAPSDAEKPPISPYKEPTIPSAAASRERLTAPPKLPQEYPPRTSSKHYSTRSATTIQSSIQDIPEIPLPFADITTPSHFTPRPPPPKHTAIYLPPSYRDTVVSMRTGPPTPPPKSPAFPRFPQSCRNSRGYIRSGPVPPPKDLPKDLLRGSPKDSPTLGLLCNTPPSRWGTINHKRSAPSTPALKNAVLRNSPNNGLVCSSPSRRGTMNPKHSGTLSQPMKVEVQCDTPKNGLGCNPPSRRGTISHKRSGPSRPSTPPSKAEVLRVFPCE